MKKNWICGILALCLLITMLPHMALSIFAVENMTVSQDMLDVVKKMEGFATYPYWDYSQWTVGYGTECPPDKLEEYKKNGITVEIGEELLRIEIASFEEEVNEYAQKYNLTFKQHEFDALVSLSYNCGGNWKWEKHGILNQAIRSGATGNDLIYAMSLYSKAHKDYVLIRRRLTEANMYLNGIYKAYNRDDDAYPENYRYVFLDGNGGDVTYAIHGYDSKANPQVRATFTKIPTGIDENGNAFVYTFAGWYTEPAGGTKVESLDGSLSNGTMLYARWADPNGDLAVLPKGDVIEGIEVTVTSTANIRSGPGSYYSKLGTLEKGSSVIITETFTTNGSLWGKFGSGWIGLSNTNFDQIYVPPQPPQTQWPREGVVTGTEVNVRSGPGTDYDIQYQLNTGDPVTVSESVIADDLEWGKLADGNWICLTYVEFTDDPAVPPVEEPTVTGVTLLSGPTKTEYVQMQEFLDLSGSVLQIHYSDGSCQARSITYDQVTFSNALLGETSVLVSYEGFEAMFNVTIIKATVTFLNYDGSLISAEQYEYSQPVTVPEPTVLKPADETGEYEFVGWDRPVTTCNGTVTYTAVFQLKEVEPPAPAYTPGDFDGNEVVDELDADYLLGYLLFPEFYPITIPADLDGSGTVDELDADYLLGYLLFPEFYPLPTP